MNSRERFFCTLAHKEPDRIPYINLIYPELAEKLTAELPFGVDYRDHYHEDIRLVAVDYPEYNEIRLMDQIFPLPSKAAIEKARRESEAFKERGLITANAYVPGIFEHVKAFTDDEFALTNMMLEPEDMKKIISNITDWLCRLYERFAKIGFDICFNGDDMGTQRSTIMSMACYREFYKPNHQKLYENIKSANPETSVAFHCCGYVHTILPEWIDIGIEIINSLQPEANDLQFIKESFGDKITFWGSIGLQSNLFHLSAEEVIQELRRCFRIMAPGGGFIASTSNYATAEVSIDRIKLLYKTLSEYGRYPNPGALTSRVPHISNRYHQN